jgi:hypothetical protein
MPCSNCGADGKVCPKDIDAKRQPTPLSYDCTVHDDVTLSDSSPHRFIIAYVEISELHAIWPELRHWRVLHSALFVFPIELQAVSTPHKLLYQSRH